MGTFTEPRLDMRANHCQGGDMKKIVLIVGALVLVLGVGVVLRKRAGGADEITA